MVVLVLVLSEPVAPVVLVEPLVAPTVPLALVLLRDVSFEATELLFCVLVSVEDVLELDGVLLVEPFAATDPLAPMPAPLADREVSVLDDVLLGEDAVVELALGVVLATLEFVSEEDVVELVLGVVLATLELVSDVLLVPLVLEPVVSVAAVVLELGVLLELAVVLGEVEDELLGEDEVLALVLGEEELLPALGVEELLATVVDGFVEPEVLVDAVVPEALVVSVELEVLGVLLLFRVGVVEVSVLVF